MKCPICGTILDKAFINDKIRGCPKCRNMGNIELWQELIRTHKALETGNIDLSDKIGKLETELDRTQKQLVTKCNQLEIAVDALKYANKCIKSGCVNWETEIDKALEQITAREQKDVK